MAAAQLAQRLNDLSLGVSVAYSTANVALNVPQYMDEILKIQDIAKSDTSATAVLIYKGLRILQEVDFLNAYFSVTGKTSSAKVYQDAASRLRKLLSATISNGVDFSAVCGREFLRFALDRALINEFIPNVKIEPYAESGKASDEFVRLVTPENVRGEVDKGLTSGSAAGLVAMVPVKTRHFFVCDCIRYIMSVTSTDYKGKASFIIALLEAVSVEACVTDTFEVSAGLCVDLFAFRTGDEDSLVRVFFEIHEKFPLLTYFVERVGARFPKIAMSVAAAMSVCSYEIPSTFVRWPEVQQKEATGSKGETKALVSEAVDKLKWSRRDAPGILSACIGQVLPIVRASGPCELNIPVKRNRELCLVVQHGNTAVLSALCMTDSGLLELVVYELGLARSVTVLRDVMLELLKSEVADAVLPALSKVLLILPELLESVGDALSQVPPSVNPSSFIRYMCCSCTSDELTRISQLPLFPSETRQIVQLLVDGIQWREAAQCSLWIIVKAAFVCPRYRQPIIEAVQGSLVTLATSSIALTQLKFLLRRAEPSSLLLPLFTSMCRSGESVQAVTVAVLKAWCTFYPDEALQFSNDNIALVRQFFSRLSPTNLTAFPSPLRHLVT